MARMLGIHASSIRGSIGGNTFLANQFHQIVIRQRTSPVQPGTTFQSQVKSGFSGGVSNWENASQAYRDGWNAYAQTVTFQGPLGPYQPSGRDLAIGQWAATQYIIDIGGVTPLSGQSMEPPTSAGLMSMDALQVQPLAAAGTGFAVQIKNSNGEDVYLYGARSLKQSNARNFYKGPWDPSSVLVTGITDGSTDTLEFDGLEEDGVYFARIRIISQEPPRRMATELIVRAVASETVV